MRMITQEQVDRSLNSAIDNGYDIETWPAWKIAEDIHEYDASFEDLHPPTLVPYIQDWLDRRIASRLNEVKQLVSDGKFEISNEAVKRGPHSVVVVACPNGGILFQWSRPGIGFGEIFIGVKDGALRTDVERMGDEFVLDVIRQALAERPVKN